jgi:hypothetical protein
MIPPSAAALGTAMVRALAVADLRSLVAERTGLASRGLRIQRTDSCPRLVYANRNLPDEPFT